MSFNSFEYIIFYIIFFALFFSIREIKNQIWLIVASSIYFYGAWSPEHVFLLLSVCLIAYLSQKDNKFYTIRSPIILLLVILTFYKYSNFILEQFVTIEKNLFTVDILLPVGISFYIFQAVSFVVDHNRQHIKFIRMSSVIAYISFFPQLVAGPIVRASVFLPQLSKTRKFNKYMMRTGLLLFAMGMFKKVVIADNLGVFVDEVYSSSGDTTAANHWIAFYLYAIQIYYDFCGYSEMAIGIARTLGFKFPRNFSRPYLSSSITEFWQRWHISLSSWLRDYLYIPLGGNRISHFRTYINLTIVMLLGGLWHGASWNFVIWGAIHGGLLAIERLVRYKHQSKFSNIFGIIVTFNLVCISWVFFRSADLNSALNFFSALTDLSTIGTITTKFVVIKCLLLVAIFFIIEKYSNSFVFVKLRNKFKLLASAIIYSFLLLLMGSFTNSPFIYFQF